MTFEGDLKLKLLKRLFLTQNGILIQLAAQMQECLWQPVMKK